MLRSILIATILAPFAYSATPAKPFIDCTREELVRAVPDLSNLQLDPNQGRLDEILRGAGKNLENSLANIENASAAEQIDELRLGPDMSVVARKETFEYDITLRPPKSADLFQEVRIDPGTKSPARASDGDFLVLSYFYKLLAYMLPEHREDSQFRYLGELNSGGRHYFVLAFAQHAESKLPSHVAISPGRSALTQGIVWIDAANNSVTRLRADLLGSIETFPLETLTTDLTLAPVTFKYAQGPALLVTRVTVHATYRITATQASGEFHTVHRYVGYGRAGQNVSAAAVPSDAESSAKSNDDAYELLAQGIASLRNNDANAAIALFRASLRLNPAIPAARFNLANALIPAGDLTGAETELREGVKLMPESVLFHNLLGGVLGRRGDAAGAVAEFRTCTQLLPKEASLHFNLAQALERTGDHTAALAEYRTASGLAPDNTAFKTQLAKLESAPPPPTTAPQPTFRTEVRQVLVPVIVADKDGHHVTGLTQDDFHVFEDGVEQKITAFSAEDSGLAVESSAPLSARGNASSKKNTTEPVVAKTAQIRQTYLICIDTLHSSEANLSSFRNALLKFFRSENSADSQYILVAMGTALEVLQDVTPDRDRILKAIEGKQFQKVFKDSRMAAGNFDLAAFRDRLDRLSAVNCNQNPQPPECEEKSLLPGQERQLASEDRSLNKTYFAQLRKLVGTLKDVTGRRSIILISDGFSMVPGKEPLELLLAYFPEFGGTGQSLSLDATDRMEELEPVLRMASNDNIPIHTIDSRGLHSGASQYFDVSSSGAPSANGSSSPSGAHRSAVGAIGAFDQIGLEAGATLAEISETTGGTSFRNSNDLVKGLQLAFADGRQYYMLSYVSTNTKTDGKFRTIGVKLRDSKVSAKAKRGYWASPN